MELTEPISEPLTSQEPPPLVQPTPNNPPWNSWIALALWFLSVVFIVLAPAVLLLPYLASKGVLSGPQEEIAKYASTDPTAIVIQMLAIIPAHLFTLIFAWLVVTNRGRFSFRETLGFRSGGVRWWHHIALLVLFLGLVAAANTFFPDSENEFMRLLRSSRAVVFVIAFMATFTAPLIEEVIYRGVLYSAFQRTIGPAVAVAFVTLIFALVHVPQYWGSPASILLLLFLSLVLTIMRVASGNLLPCIVFHTIVNGFQSAGLIAEPYLKQAAGVTETAALFFT